MEWLLLIGLEASRGLGEGQASLLVQAQGEHKYGVARVFADTSKKVESGRGFILGGDLDFHPRVGPLIGLGYRYRDGGAWVKKSGWARIGLALDWMTLAYAIDMTTRNKVRVVELTERLRGSLAVEVRIGLVMYDQDQAGNYFSMSVGWAP